MSKFSKWLGDRIGNGPSMSGLRSSIKGTGHFAGEVGQYAAPLVSIANPMLGAGIAGVSAGLRGKSVGDMLKDAAITGATGYALGHAGDVLNKAKGFFGDASEAAGDVASGALDPASLAVKTTPASSIADIATPKAASIAGGAPIATTASSAATAAPKSFARRALDYVGDHPGDVLVGAGRVGGALLEANTAGARNALDRRRLDLEEDQMRRENALADQQNLALNPMRQALLQQMLRRLGLPITAYQAAG